MDAVQRRTKSDKPHYKAIRQEANSRRQVWDEQQRMSS